MLKFGTKVPHLRCDSHISFKVKRSKVRVTDGRGHTVSAEPGDHTACFSCYDCHCPIKCEDQRRRRSTQYGYKVSLNERNIDIFRTGFIRISVEVTQRKSGEQLYNSRFRGVLLVVAVKLINRSTVAECYRFIKEKFSYETSGFPLTWKVRESQGKSGNQFGQGKSGNFVGGQGILVACERKRRLCLRFRAK